jgi:hypothetical protein
MQEDLVPALALSCHLLNHLELMANQEGLCDRLASGLAIELWGPRQDMSYTQAGAPTVEYSGGGHFVQSFFVPVECRQKKPEQMVARRNL